MEGQRKTRSLLAMFKHRSKSHISHSTTQTTSYKTDFSSPGTFDDTFEDQRDGFYRYSESIVEESKPSGASPCGSQEENFGVFDSLIIQKMAKKHHSRPYTVSSNDWVKIRSSPIPASPTHVRTMEDLNQENLQLHFSVVMRIFSRVYAIAKILHVIFLAYGIELDNNENGFMYWIKRSERGIRTDSLRVLIESVENLFYTIYARLQLEMAAVELCDQLPVREKRPSIDPRKFQLPGPVHLYRIYCTFKNILDHRSICEAPKDDIIALYQEDYIKRQISQNEDRTLFVSDTKEYRNVVLRVLIDKTSVFREKWDGLIPIFPSIPPKIMIFHSENYLTAFPKVTPEPDLHAVELPFLDLKTLDPIAWEKELILDNRQAALAILEGRVIGELRREDANYPAVFPVKYYKCICRSCCICAVRCTLAVEKPCPCARRQLRIEMAKLRRGPGRFDFVTRVTTLALSFWQGLVFMKRNVDSEALLVELMEFFSLFSEEIIKERHSVIIREWD
ncbi:hypothetical protein N7495_007806 [Penicillium taxi]|uniref:uncharacterized protein n=1 Tax=Penicillium taxi TaxID=168475 RepID=UPI0025452609|nr:uncharacterized protein N7495_007806 [Penicillium taxi]KAJ5887765.1 hypothetical protein N7495_007806 [Penicillium taxi]